MGKNRCCPRFVISLKKVSLVGVEKETQPAQLKMKHRRSTFLTKADIYKEYLVPEAKRTLNAFSYVLNSILENHANDYSSIPELREMFFMRMAVNDLVDWFDQDHNEHNYMYARKYIDTLIDIVGTLPKDHIPSARIASVIKATELSNTLTRNNNWTNYLHPIRKYIDSLFDKYQGEPRSHGGPQILYCVNDKPKLPCSTDILLCNWDRMLKEVKVSQSKNKPTFVIKVVARVPYRGNGEDHFLVTRDKIDEFENVDNEDIPNV